MGSHKPEVGHLLAAYTERRIDRRRFFTLAAASGLAMSSAASLLAACGGGDDDATPGTVPTTDKATPQRGGALRVGYERDVARMDPVNTSYMDPAAYPTIHETLLAVDPNTGALVPGFAESFEANEDATVWTVKIRDGLTFHSGKPVTAEAVAACFRDFKDPMLGVGAFLWADTEITAEEGNILKFTTSHPYYALKYSATHSWASVYDAELRAQLGETYGVEGTAGTGPFVLEEFVPGSHTLVKRWDSYTGSLAPFYTNKGTAYLDSIRWNVLAEGATRAPELESGGVDALHQPLPQDLERLKSNPDLVVAEFPDRAVFFIAPNFQETSLGFDDVRVRQALSHAIDRDAIVKAVFDGKGAPAWTLVSTTFPQYNSEVEKFNKFDPDKARTLLKDAGFPDLSFQVTAQEEGYVPQILQAVQQMYKDIGVTMDIELLQPAEFFGKVAVPPGAQAYAYNLNTYILFESMVSFLAEENVSPACCNWNFAVLPDLTEAFGAWRNAGNEEQYVAALSQAQLVAAEQLPLIPIVTQPSTWAWNKKVHNWFPNPNYSDTPYYLDVWMEQ